MLIFGVLDCCFSIFLENMQFNIVTALVFVFIICVINVNLVVV